MQPLKRSLSPAERKQWLAFFNAQKIQLEQSEWRHERFCPELDGLPQSRYIFFLHARQPAPKTRYIVRGQIQIRWRRLSKNFALSFGRQDALLFSSFFQLAHIFLHFPFFFGKLRQWLAGRLGWLGSQQVRVFWLSLAGRLQSWRQRQALRSAFWEQKPAFGGLALARCLEAVLLFIHTIKHLYSARRLCPSCIFYSMPFQ